MVRVMAGEALVVVGGRGRGGGAGG